MLIPDGDVLLHDPGVYVADHDRVGNIYIMNDNIKVDFAGHYSMGHGDAAVYSYGHSGVTVENGHIWGSSLIGIYVEGDAIGNSRVDAMEVYGQTLTGIQLGGNGNIMDNNFVHDIGNNGDPHTYMRAYGTIVHGNDIVAYNSVYSIHGAVESVNLALDGGSNQVYGNTYADWGNWADSFLFWSDSDHDYLSNNSFINSQGDAHAVHGEHLLTSKRNDFYNYSGPDDPFAFQLATLTGVLDEQDDRFHFAIV